MVNRMHRCPTFVLALLLGASSPALAATSGTDSVERRVSAPAPAARLAEQNGAQERQPRLAGRKVRRTVSNFVRLAGLIVATTEAGVGNELTGSAFDQEWLEGLLAHGLPGWFAHRPASGGHDEVVLPEAFQARNAIGIRTMYLEPGGFHPLFGDLFRPTIRGRYVGHLDETTPFDQFAAGESALAATAWSSTVSAQRHNKENGSANSPYTYRYAMDRQTAFMAGIGWIQDLGDTTGLSSSLEEPYDDGSSGRHSGVNLSLGGRYKAVSFTGGYIRALDSRSSSELALAGKDGDPIAWNSEVAYSTEWLQRETTFAVGYLKSSDILQDVLPEERYRTRASMALSESTTFSLEYYQDREFDASGGSGDGYGITTRIGVDF